MVNQLFNTSYIVNDRNRKHYGVTSPLKVEKNLFYYPNENNKKVIRKLDLANIPEHVMIYWKNNDNPDGTGSALLTEVYADSDVN